MKQKFKAYSKELGMSEALTLKELVSERTDFDEYETYLQYLGYHDSNDRELYEGDVTELIITEKLMSSSFSNSNMGKYLKEHPEVTSIVLEHRSDNPCMSMDYLLYAKVNGEFQYLANKTTKVLSSGEDSMFPMYLAEKGAEYIGNIIENPYLIKQKPTLKQNDMFKYVRPFGYTGTIKTDGEAAVISINNGIAKVQYVRPLYNRDIVNIEEIPVEEILQNANLECYPLNLKEYLYCNKYQELHNSDKEAVEFYVSNYYVSDKDKEYADSLNLEDDLELDSNYQEV